MKITRSGHHYANPKWAAWRDQVVSELRETLELERRPEALILTDCRMVVHYWAGDLRRRDVPAMLDSIFHCLEKVAIVKDDSLIKSVFWQYHGLDRENARAEVLIELGAL